MFRSNRPQCGPHIMTQLKRGDGDGANEDRVDEEDRPDEEDMSDEEDKADEVQAEMDEGSWETLLGYRLCIKKLELLLDGDQDGTTWL